MHMFNIRVRFHNRVLHSSVTCAHVAAVFVLTMTDYYPRGLFNPLSAQLLPVAADVVVRVDEIKVRVMRVHTIVIGV